MKCSSINHKCDLLPKPVKIGQFILITDCPSFEFSHEGIPSLCIIFLCSLLGKGWMSEEQTRLKLLSNHELVLSHRLSHPYVFNSYRTLVVCYVIQPLWQSPGFDSWQENTGSNITTVGTVLRYARVRHGRVKKIIWPNGQDTWLSNRCSNGGRGLVCL